MAQNNGWHKPKQTLGSITVRILENLFSAVEVVGEYNINRIKAHQSIQSVNNRYHNKNSSRWINDLKNRGYIKIEKSNGEISSVILTNKAKMKIVDAIAGSVQGDQIFRFISFDIPEKLANNRNKFRLAIKKMGFVQIQQSLWVINKDVTELVETAAYEYKVEKYIAYIVSAKSDIDGTIARKFLKTEKSDKPNNV